MKTEDTVKEKLATGHVSCLVLRSATKLQKGDYIFPPLQRERWATRDVHNTGCGGECTSRWKWTIRMARMAKCPFHLLKRSKWTKFFTSRIIKGHPWIWSGATPKSQPWPPLIISGASSESLPGPANPEPFLGPPLSHLRPPLGHSTLWREISASSQIFDCLFV